MNQVLERLNKAGLKLDPKKCEFANKEIKYLGLLVNVEEGIKVDPGKIRAIASWEAPSNVKGIRSFLGFANFYRGFIENFAQFSEPLQSLTKKGTPFRWDQDQQEAFEMLKSLFITAPVLALWDGDCHTVLETDASGWATGGCLSQLKEAGKLQPVAYYSKELSPAESNYDIHDKELLSIIRCLQEWRSELISLEKPFDIITDHKNLKYFMTTKRLTERQVRWSQLLSQFNFRLKFRAGKQNCRPDALLRRIQDMPKSMDDPRLKEREFKLLKNEWLLSSRSSGVDTREVMALTIETSIPVGDKLFEEEELQELWDRAVREDLTNFRLLYETLWKDKEEFPSYIQLKISRSECEIDGRGALCFRKRLWIPSWELLQTALIQRTHDSHLTGHPGRNSTLAILSRTFYWPGMSQMVRKFCRNCDVCGRSHV